jgi:hypothetical protein
VGGRERKNGVDCTTVRRRDVDLQHMAWGGPWHTCTRSDARTLLAHVLFAVLVIVLRLVVTMPC